MATDFEFLDDGSKKRIVAYDVVSADASGVNVDVFTGADLGSVATAGNADWDTALNVAGPVTGPFLEFIVTGTIGNDSIYAILTSFGTGYEAYGAQTSLDFSGTASGKYSALIYIITEKGAKIARQISFDWDNGTKEFSNIASEVSAPTTYDVSAECVWVDCDCQNNLVNPVTAAGPYTVLGQLGPCKPDMPCAEMINGQRLEEYIDYRFEKLCEIDAEYLLLIDNGGQFARYSFYTRSWTPVTTLSVQSAGGSADVENFVLYSFVAPDQLFVADVNTDTQLPTVTLVDGVINPAVATNPKTFSAAAFRDANGRLYAWDPVGAGAGVYSVNPATGAVDFVTTVTGVVGSGTSIMIDNETDTLYINGTNLSYQVDWTTGVATLWGNPPVPPNGGTFDQSGNAYVTADNDTYYLPKNADANDPNAWIQIIDDWTPGANSLAYYRVQAQEPRCFFRKYGVQKNGDIVYISDHNTSDGSLRTIVGDINCCDVVGGGDSVDPPTVLDCPDPETQTIPGSGPITGPGTIPAGLKTVTINSISGTNVLPNGFEIGGGRRANIISVNSSNHPCINGVLTDVEVTGTGTWQWIGVE